VRGLSVLDTFPAFEEFWGQAQRLPVDEQVDLWEYEYMVRWPALLAKQKRNYAEEGVDWKQVATSRIFPHLTERLPIMRRLRRELLTDLPSTWKRIQRVLKPRFPIRLVLYVGIGCGAGWATRLEGQPACLIGFENAAETTQGNISGIRSLVPHEVAHLVHNEWRRKSRRGDIDTPGGSYWQLYTEGFATEIERRIVSPDVFRRRTGRLDWEPWCQAHRTWLARKFLHDTRARRSTRPFFGSWYNIQGQIETGYWLGAQMIREWAERKSIPEISTLGQATVGRWARGSLRGMVQRNGR
jgi:hypothetical protein